VEFNMSNDDPIPGQAPSEQQHDEQAGEKAQRPSYSASRSARHRPTLSLHGLHWNARARTVQLSWMALNRPL
jgi:hypothetical protein